MPGSARASWSASTLTGAIATLASGEELSYDYLIIGTGVSAAFFGVPGAAEHSMSLYTRRDAIALRNELLATLERRNEGLTDPELDVTIVGGGATGVELAGTLAELRNLALPAVFPEIDRSMFKVRLVEMGPALLAPYDDSLRQYTRQQLVDRGVEVLLNTAIKEVRPGSVLLADGSEHRSDITVWAAGISAPDAGLDVRPAARQGRPDRGRCRPAGNRAGAGLRHRGRVDLPADAGSAAGPARDPARTACGRAGGPADGWPADDAVQVSRQGHDGDDRPPLRGRRSCAAAYGCAARSPGSPGSGCT